MNQIEIIGPPGSGKSTIKRGLGNKPVIHSSDQVIRENIERDLLGNYKLAIDHISTPLYDYVLDKIWKYKYRDHYVREFKREYSDLYRLIIKEGNEDKRENYPRMYLNSASKYMFVGEKSGGDDIHIFDEGLYQMASEMLRQSEENGYRYLQELPVPNYLLFVDATPETCLQRQKDREKKVASSLRNCDYETAINRLERYRSYYRTICEKSKLNSENIIKIDSESLTPEQCIRESVENISFPT
ncbi:AAA family ATPase [Natronococcus sp. A-GB7]|uniref:AAA family ATPase n=1 Tax=Natronococcus sp. A-GB7 TaxID=3037649 RepID=UPI00241F30B0|nr:AAA family ATPase [Natronococcus sp. A-GB7]MDG5821294.1 AAA family ATPase [Natronococcus sp. A-GB7]